MFGCHVWLPCLVATDAWLLTGELMLGGVHRAAFDAAPADRELSISALRESRARNRDCSTVSCVSLPSDGHTPGFKVRHDGMMA
jgi:hypothetical protein